MVREIEMKIKALISSGLAVVLLAFGVSNIAKANLISNASFEDVPSTATGQGILPTDWVNIPPPTPTADTYSNDGSYGLAPSAGGNFTGVTAYDGIRWVAGWSAQGQESFGQWLGTSLVAGVEYDLSGWLHQAVRNDLNYPGGYNVYLTNTPGVQTELLGFLGSTTSVSAGWDQFGFSFTATDTMASLGFLEFAPIATQGGSAYPGLDLVSLEAVSSVPEPSIIALLGIGFAGMVIARRKK